MIYSHEVETMCPIAQGVAHGAAPIPEEAKWVKAKEIKDISGFTHGIGWCAPQQGTCKLTLNVKEGVIQEALVETIGCSGMTHSAAMAAEILPGKTLLEALTESDAVLIKGIGALCTGFDESEAEAVAIVLEKACMAAYLAHCVGNIPPLSKESAKKDREGYVNHYSKLK